MERVHSLFRFHWWGKFVFENAFANGKKIHEALPSILAGTAQVEWNNSITSLSYNKQFYYKHRNLLSRLNYSSSFYPWWAPMENYEFLMPLLKVGYWEILWQERIQQWSGLRWPLGHFLMNPTFNIMPKELGKKQAPFFSTIFRLSSLTLTRFRRKHKGTNSKGILDVHESVVYSDYP